MNSLNRSSLSAKLDFRKVFFVLATFCNCTKWNAQVEAEEGSRYAAKGLFEVYWALGALFEVTIDYSELSQYKDASTTNMVIGDEL